MSDRRGFLKTLIGAGLVAAADPERLLWVPGEKAIFIPSPPSLGISIRIIRQYDIAWNTSELMLRDHLYLPVLSRDMLRLLINE